MDCVEIRGGIPLHGSVEIQGSKNAVLPLLAGCILHRGVSRIAYCPRIRDVFDTIELLEVLGCRVWWEESCLVVDAARVDGWEIPAFIASRMRSSILFLGALLGRMGKAKLPYPGGCVLGARPIDMHLQAMQSMGAAIREWGGTILAEATDLQGGEITLRFPSVGATENAVLAAIGAQGRTVIRNAAREPEVLELCRFFQEKGADICWKSQGIIEIIGGKPLKDSLHVLSADRIVAGTYLMAAAVTDGCITVRRMPMEHMTKVRKVLESMGIQFLQREGEWVIDCRGKRSNLELLETAPYPEFPTDLQSPMMTLLSVTRGESRIRENIFDARFKTAIQLQKMGAEITVHGKEALIRGVERLRGAEVEAEELRGAAALFLAGLNASGVTTIRGCRYISRGYENICENLQSLGADIRT